MKVGRPARIALPPSRCALRRTNRRPGETALHHHVISGGHRIFPDEQAGLDLRQGIFRRLTALRASSNSAPASAAGVRGDPIRVAEDADGVAGVLKGVLDWVVCRGDLVGRRARDARVL